MNRKKRQIRLSLRLPLFISVMISRITKIFRTEIIIHENSRIETRIFPYKLKISYTLSLQDRIKMGGHVKLEAATYLCDRTIEIKNPVLLEGNTNIDRT